MTHFLLLNLESSCLAYIDVPALFLKALWLGAVVHVFNPAFGKQKKTDLCGCKVSQSELQVFQGYLVRLLFHSTKNNNSNKNCVQV